jgi:hypothetical protein
MRHRSGSIAALALAAWLSASCTSVIPHYDASKSHHRPDGFNNNYVDNWGDRPSFWRWQLQR